MSYLNSLRLHFSGKFQMRASTVNNDIMHYRIDTFDEKKYWEKMTGTNDPSEWNGWWNPKGDSVFRLVGCKISEAHYRDGTSAASPSDDPVMGWLISDAGDRVSAKMVDLDPHQQLASEIWGLAVGVVDATGDPKFRGLFETAAFTEFWPRVGSGIGSDEVMGAMWQSVLSFVYWNESAVAESRFVKELKEASQDGLLSIKFNVDRYNGDVTSPGFLFGRIVGTIGPASASEPKRFVLGRHFLPEWQEDGQPRNRVNQAAAVLDEASKTVLLDLGNSLPTADPRPPKPNAKPYYRFETSNLYFGYMGIDDNSKMSFRPIEALQLGGEDWYESSAGIVRVPFARSLTEEEFKTLSGATLALARLTPEHNEFVPLIQEGAGGYYLRADHFTDRLNPDESKEFVLYATRYGRPQGAARILCYRDSSGLQSSSYMATKDDPEPDFGVPEWGIEFSPELITDAQGKAVLRVTGRSPGCPRRMIDGQVYGIRYQLSDTLQGGWINGILNRYQFSPWNFLSIVVWDEFKLNGPPTWADVFPILQQYRNLYPVMQPIIDMTDQACLLKYSRLIQRAMSLPREDPNHMPTTRDLSDAKRKAIVDWLELLSTGKAVDGSSPAVLPKPVAPPSIPPGPDSGNQLRLPDRLSKVAVVRRLIHKKVV